MAKQEKQAQLNIRLNEDLYLAAQDKCNKEFGIGLAPLIKIFLRSYVTQEGVGFYVGNDDLCDLFKRWLMKKKSAKDLRGYAREPGPKLKDLYQLNPAMPGTNGFRYGRRRNISL